MLDLFSRKVAWWAVAPTIRRELALDAVFAAVQQRRSRGTLIHSDRGFQYGSDAWRRFSRTHHPVLSMSRKGNCWDNAVADSFLSNLKKEPIKKRILPSQIIALASIAMYIRDLYSPTRRHSHLGGREPRAVRDRASATAARCPLLAGNSTVLMLRSRSADRKAKVPGPVLRYEANACARGLRGPRVLV